jgi:TPR repeat protein
LTLTSNELAAFFSYSRDDSSFVVQLAADMKAAGANVWLDQLDITPGQRWDRAIEDALKNCPRLIVILSPTSVNSTNVMDEVSFALEEQKTVIPVVYRDCAIPFRLRRLQYVDFKHDYSQGFKELLSVVAPQQKPEPGAPTISDVRDVPAMNKGREVAERAGVEAARTRATARESSGGFVSRYPGGLKAVAAVFAVLIVGLIFYWKFLPSPTKKQAQDVPRVTAQPESTNAPPVVPQEPEPLRKTDQGQPIRAVPSQKKANAEKSEARGITSAKNSANDVFEKGKLAAHAGQFDAALQDFQQAAAAGDSRAMNDLGVLYYEGHGVAKDYQRAREWYEKGAAAGNAEAMGNLGYLYLDGLGVTKDYDQARQWLEKGAMAGNGRAMTHLGYMYREGLGVTKDYDQARQWLEKGAAAGNGRAMAYLGVMYERGSGVPKDYRRAKQLFGEGAAAGDGRAMNNMAGLYADGHGVSQDYTQARQWYEKAAAAGDATGMLNLGWLYHNGLGVTQDQQRAREWYEKAAAAGNAMAMNNLGAMYANGKVVAQDFQQARQWYERAAAAGNAMAMSNLGALYEGGLGVPHDYRRARQLYEEAARAGDSHGMTHLGHLYEAGLGVPKDYRQARQWYEKAAAAGDEQAQNALKKLPR